MAGVKRRTSAIPRPRLQVGVIFGVYFAAIACGVVAVIHGPSNAKYVALAALLVGPWGLCWPMFSDAPTAPSHAVYCISDQWRGQLAGRPLGKISPVCPSPPPGFWLSSFPQ